MITEVILKKGHVIDMWSNIETSLIEPLLKRDCLEHEKQVVDEPDIYRLTQDVHVSLII